MIRKITVCLFACMLACLMLACGAAAQETSYTPGKPTSEAFLSAFENGKMIKADMQFSLDANPSVMDMSGPEAAAAMMEALKNVKLTLGAGKIDKGVRLELAAQYDGQAPIDAAAALNISYDGLLLETSLLEGEAVSVNWETLLALAGLDSTQAQMILSLRDQDLQVLTLQLIESVGPYLQMAAQALTPYGETISGHIASLPMEISENTADDGFYPAAAQEIAIAVTAADAGSLITKLADQLEKDAILGMLIQSVLAQQTDIPVKTTAELCAMIREAAALLTDSAHPLTVYVGMSETGTPLYLSANVTPADTVTLVFDVVYRPGARANAGAVMVNLCTADLTAEEAMISDGFVGEFAFDTDPENKNLFAYTGNVYIYAGGEPILITEYASNNSALITPDGQNGYSGSHLAAINAADGESIVTVTFSGDTQSAQTAAGGERTMLNGVLEILADGNTIPMTMANEMVFTPEISGPVCVYTESSAAAEMGVHAAKETYTLYTETYDPAATAALRLTRLEDLSTSDMQALTDRFIASAEDLIGRLQAALPPALVEEIADAL